MAADIRKLRKPEPYKGKGVRYAGERVAAQGRKGSQVMATHSDRKRTCASGATPGCARKVTGTAERPRLAVFRSNRHISAQVIDDTAGRTLAAASHGRGRPARRQRAATSTAATAVGTLVADAGQGGRGHHRWSSTVGASGYHGRVAALADAARAEGLEF